MTPFPKKIKEQLCIGCTVDQQNKEVGIMECHKLKKSRIVSKFIITSLKKDGTPKKTLNVKALNCYEENDDYINFDVVTVISRSHPRTLYRVYYPFDENKGLDCMVKNGQLEGIKISKDE